MPSICNLHARPGAGAAVSIWRVDQTNANTVVILSISPALSQASAVAFTAGAGDDRGRIDLTLTNDAPAGAYEWTATINGVEVFAGAVYVANHGRSASFASHSVDIRSLTSPPWIIPRADDVEGESVGGGPATQVRETSGPTILDLGAVADGEVLTRDGTSLVGSTPGGGGPATQLHETGGPTDLDITAIPNGSSLCDQGPPMPASLTTGRAIPTRSTSSNRRRGLPAVTHPWMPTQGLCRLRKCCA